MRAVSGSSSPSPVRVVSVTRARMASVRGLSSIWARRTRSVRCSGRWVRTAPLMALSSRVMVAASFRTTRS
ncbi:hypothetical protein C0Q58_19100 [Streptomyces albidoflavus]|nr:hypothetical protein P405_27465 [Streptomyces sp. FR-008]RZD60176.1 hypothetical protein C0Q58_19100 [Streptomyces albidoflavus]